MKTELEFIVNFEVWDNGDISAWLESDGHPDLHIRPYLSESDKTHLVDASFGKSGRGSTGQN